MVFFFSADRRDLGIWFELLIIVMKNLTSASLSVIIVAYFDAAATFNNVETEEEIRSASEEKQEAASV